MQYNTNKIISISIIVNMILKNERLKKMLFYTTKDCLSKPNLTEDESLGLFGKNIKLIPKIPVDKSVLNYIVVRFDQFTPNMHNTEFRDNILEFDIICHIDQWQMKDFELRHLKIAAEIDSMFNQQRLTGIGKIEFLGARQFVLTDEFSGLCLLYRAVHGDEDKQKMPNPINEQAFIENFDNMFNEHRVQK